MAENTFCLFFIAPGAPNIIGDIIIMLPQKHSANVTKILITKDIIFLV